MANVNILSYTNNLNDTQTVASKPYTDKSGAFDNILESASKTYSNDDNTYLKSINAKKEEFNNKTTDKPADKVSDKPAEKDSEVKKDKPVEKNVEKDSKTETTKDEQAETSKKSTTDESSETKTDKDTKAENKTALEQAVENAAKAIAKPITEIIDTAANELAQAQQQKTDKENELKVDLAQQSMNAKDLAATAKTNKAKVQSQTQQVVLNLKTGSAETIAKAQTPSPEELSAKAPLVQSNVDTTAEANGKMSKKELKEALQQSGLSQDLLDKTNAKVISVETSSTSDNLLNKQNAQEHGVKLALENNNVTSSIDTTVQTTFEKTLDGIQQPKEISKTDILAQINTKFEQMKDESTTKVTIVLKPESLGKINLELINGKDGLTARMTTENAQVKELLDKNLDTLRNSLGTQGVSVNSVTVKVAEAQTPSNENFSFEQRESNQGNQEFQDNASNSNQKNYSFEEEFANHTTAKENENATSKTAYAGQIDYKI